MRFVPPRGWSSGLLLAAAGAVVGLGLWTAGPARPAQRPQGRPAPGRAADGPLLEGRASGVGGPTAPAAAAPLPGRAALVGPEDPWTPEAPRGPVGGAGATDDPVERAHRRTRLLRMRVGSQAVGTAGVVGADAEHSTWEAPPDADGFLSVSYDLGLLAPHGLSDPPYGALEGVAEPRWGSDSRRWWVGLCSRLAEAVGASAWPEEETLLGCEPWEGQLYLRQTPRALATVEGVLAEVAAEQAAVVPLRLEFPAPGGTAPANALPLDVPYGRAVRTARVLAYAALLDFDVECGNSTALFPIVGAVEGGVGLSAYREASVGGPDGLFVEVACASGAPSLRRQEVGFFAGGLQAGDADLWVVEVAAPAPCASWRGRLPAAAGRHRLRLSDGSTVVLEVGAPVSPSTAREAPERRPFPGLPRVAADLGPAPPPGPEGGGLEAVWRPLRTGRVFRAPFVAVGGRVEARLEPPTLGFAVPGAPALEVTDEFGLEARAGGVCVGVEALPLQDGTLLLDLRVRAGRPVARSRRVPAAALPYGAGRPVRSELDLPICRCLEECRRLVLSPGTRAQLTLEADLGAGPEAFELTIDDVR